MIRDILLLGDPRLHEKSGPVNENELINLDGLICDLHSTLFEYRRKHDAGRAIAAPQIGVFKRVIYMYIDKPVIFINPSLHFLDDEMMEVMDDCMSFPGLKVRVMRHKHCKIEYTDEKGNKLSMELKGDLSELIQHEYDHLDGILATMRAVDNKSFFIFSIINRHNKLAVN